MPTVYVCKIGWHVKIIHSLKFLWNYGSPPFIDLSKIPKPMAIRLAQMVGYRFSPPLAQAGFDPRCWHCKLWVLCGTQCAIMPQHTMCMHTQNTCWKEKSPPVVCPEGVYFMLNNRASNFNIFTSCGFIIYIKKFSWIQLIQCYLRILWSTLYSKHPPGAIVYMIFC